MRTDVLCVRGFVSGHNPSAFDSAAFLVFFTFYLRADFLSISGLVKVSSQAMFLCV